MHYDKSAARSPPHTNRTCDTSSNPSLEAVHEPLSKLSFTRLKADVEDHEPQCRAKAIDIAKLEQGLIFGAAVARRSL
jgi:hypothetical protein